MADHKFVELDQILATFESDRQRQRFLEVLLSPELADPDWEGKTRVHDWRNYVSPQLQLVWPDLTSVVRALIYQQAAIWADDEEWD